MWPGRLELDYEHTTLCCVSCSALPKSLDSVLNHYGSLLHALAQQLLNIKTANSQVAAGKLITKVRTGVPNTGKLAGLLTVGVWIVMESVRFEFAPYVQVVSCRMFKSG